MIKQIIGILLLLIIMTSASIYFYAKQTYPDTPHLTSMQYFVEHLAHPHAKLTKHTMGFLPYWQPDNVQYIKPELLSEINYFSFSVGTDGHIAKVTNGETDPGWNAWQKQTMKNFVTKSHILGAAVTVTIAALQNDLIDTILNDRAAQQNLITDTVSEVKKSKLDGINIDFEYFGTPDSGTQAKFTQFSKSLSSALKKDAPGTKLSLSIMPLAARQDDIFDFKKLSPIYDRFIGMSYEYYGASSDIAGPIAPMRGYKENKYFFDVTTTYEDYLKVIPKDKIVMGVPYYGWEWAVRDGKTINSRTYPSANANSYAAVISYARSRESTDLKKSQCFWDTYAQEPWCWYTDKATGIDRQVWYEDARSIETKFDYATQQKLAGVAIWTLGMDKNYPDLWDMMRKKFSSK